MKKKSLDNSRFDSNATTKSKKQPYCSMGLMGSCQVGSVIFYYSYQIFQGLPALVEGVPPELYLSDFLSGFSVEPI